MNEAEGVVAVVTKKIRIGRLSAYQNDADYGNVVIKIEARDHLEETDQTIVLSTAAARHFGAMMADLFEEV